MSGGIKVEDDEGIVDKKVKNHITDLRRQNDAKGVKALLNRQFGKEELEQYV